MIVVLDSFRPLVGVGRPRYSARMTDRVSSTDGGGSIDVVRWHDPCSRVGEEEGHPAVAIAASEECQYRSHRCCRFRRSRVSSTASRTLRTRLPKFFISTISARTVAGGTMIVIDLPSVPR
jgi:hypothetical protein